MKSGFVMLAGRSNVGKSTLLNELIGSKVAIVTPKPQTTRHPVRGVLHDPRGQIVFVDTPGIFLGRKDRVSHRLNEYVHETLQGIDAVVYVTDPTRDIGAEEMHIQELLRLVQAPIILVINKIDMANPAHLEAYRNSDIGQVQRLEISAKKRKNFNQLIDALFALLPEGPPHYPELQLTDMGHNQWLEELIREKIFLCLEKEIPYSTKVSIEHIETRDDGSRFIQANIWTTHERYKRMIIGKGGSMLKRIGSAARKEIEEVSQGKIFLQLEIQVDEKWQERFV